MLDLPRPRRRGRQGRPLAGEHGKRPIVGGPVEVRLPQQDLADLVGTTRESVNKHLRVWEEAGIVALGRGRVVLAQPKLLEQIATAVHV